MKTYFFFVLFLILFFKTADLRSYCGFFWQSASFVFSFLELFSRFFGICILYCSLYHMTVGYWTINYIAKSFASDCFALRTCEELSATWYQYLLLYFFNSRTAIAGTIIGLLLEFFISSWFLFWPYDVTTTSKLLFVHLFIQLQLNCACDVIFHS